jgi:HSP20 family molecular chaperone IbpA
MTPFDRENTPISDVIEGLLDALERADREDRTTLYGGTRRADRPFGMDYGFDVRWGLDSFDTDEPPTEEHRSHLVDTRRTDDGMGVVADLPDVDRDDVTVRIDEEHRFLEIGTDDGVIERVPLPWPAEVRTTRLNNGVLDVVLAPKHEENDE